VKNCFPFINLGNQGQSQGKPSTEKSSLITRADRRETSYDIYSKYDPCQKTSEAEQALKDLSDDFMPKGSTFGFTKLYGYKSLGKGATSDVIGSGKFAFKVIYVKNEYDIQDPIFCERISKLIKIEQKILEYEIFTNCDYLLQSYAISISNRPSINLGVVAMDRALMDMVVYYEGGYGWTYNICKTFYGHVVKGLKHLHSRSLIHLDIKPSNILVFGNMYKNSKSIKNIHFKIADFGYLKGKSTIIDGSIGTSEFMAPELDNASVNNIKANEKLDIFSFGKTIITLSNCFEEEMRDSFEKKFAPLTSNDPNERPTILDDTLSSYGLKAP